MQTVGQPTTWQLTQHSVVSTTTTEQLDKTPSDAYPELQEQLQEKLGRKFEKA